jgi:rhomboid family GlyGly-CTERM serine protease
MRNEQSKLPLVTVAIAIWTLAISCSPLLASWLTLDFESVEIRKLPAMVSCHLAHWSTQHLFWDLLMFIVLGWHLEKSITKPYYFTLIASSLLIPLGVHVMQPEITSYRGLSGIDTALFALLCTSKLASGYREGCQKSIALFLSLLLAMWVKLLFEFSTGGVMFVRNENFTPVPAAHLCGATIGMVVAGWKSTMMWTLNCSSPDRPIEYTEL